MTDHSTQLAEGVANHSHRVSKVSSPEELPDDVAALKQMLWSMLQTNDEMTQQIAWLKRQLWGQKSERLVSPDQLALFEELKKELEERATRGEEAAGPVERMPKTTRKTRRGGKRSKTRGAFMGGSVPPDTPVQSTEVELGGACCPVCSGPLEVLGTDTRRRLGFQPGHFYIQETVVQTGLCPQHPKESLHTPAGPDFIISGGVLANDLVNKIVVDKFADGMPLNRQAKRFLRKGVRVATSTLSRTVLAYAEQAKHLVYAMRQELLSSDWLQGDATGMPIVVGGLGRTHPGQLWVYSNGDTAVFEASMTKHGDIPKAFLEGFAGAWLADGASNYNGVEELPGVYRGGCWSHARRYVFEARTDHVAAIEGLSLIRDLFMSERPAMLLDPASRLAHRAEHAAPLVERIRLWLEAQRTCDHVVRRPKSPFAKAVRYLHNQWSRLTQFLSCGDIPVHNNRSELLLRTPVVGRKAWQFAGSPAGADANAVLFSITTSCMLQGIDPMEYLDDVMPTLSQKTPSEIAELTPAKWASRRRLTAMAS